LQEIRAQRTDVQWRADPDAPYFDNVALEIAPHFVELGTVAFDLRATEAYGAVVAVRLRGSTSVNNAAECQAASLSVIRAAEEHYGPFFWEVRTIRGEHIVRTVAGSSIMVSGWRPLASPVEPSEFSDPGTTGFATRTRGALSNAAGDIKLLISSDLRDGRCQTTLEFELL